MNNFIKLHNPRILRIIPPFLLYILARNKIKRPILRKKGTAHSAMAVLVSYCPKSVMPFYLRHHAIGLNCILLVICMLDFVILSFTTQSDPIILSVSYKKGT